MNNVGNTDLGVAVFHDGRGRALNLQQSNAANVEPVMFATTNGNARTVNAQNSLTTSTTQVGYFSQASTGTAVATFGQAAAVWGQSIGGIRGGIFVAGAINNNTRALTGALGNLGNYDGVGVFADARPAADWGIGTYSLGNWRGMVSEGALQVIGAFTASGGKAFTIDHPLDPENKYLRHFSMESDEVLNVYHGNVTLDANGEATVQLPSYFGAINIDFSYHLTPIGAAANLFVKEEINAQNGTFKVAGGQSGQKVSWMVQAQRNDLYMQNRPDEKAVEPMKEVRHRGTYLHPEFYNQPAERHMYHEQRQPQNVNVPNAAPAPAPAPKDRGERVRE